METRGIKTKKGNSFEHLKTDRSGGLRVVKGTAFQKKTKGMIEMAKRLYIAYGSNLNVTQMGYRCPAARIAGTAVLNGYELLYKGSKTGAYLTIEPKKGGKVPVAVWFVTESDERALDRYEGCPMFYYKKDVTITLSGVDGKKHRVKAFVYIMHEERKLGIPTWTYIECCKEGYEDFGFDPKYLDEAYDRSVSV